MIRRSHFIAVYALLVAAGLYLNLHRDTVMPMRKPLAQFPVSVSPWRMTRESTLSPDVQNVLKATDILMREYVNDRGQSVELYIGYHSGGQGSGEIHSPKHCLPGSGWFEISSVRRQMRVSPGKTLNLVDAVYQKGDRREVFLYWFQARDKSLSDEYSLKVAELVNSVVHSRRDAAFIRISVPVSTDERQAQATGEHFLVNILPAIEEFLPV